MWGLQPRCIPTILKGGGVKAQCAPLLSFLRAVAVEGSSIPFATADLEVVAPDKALEAQRMEILQRDLLARFNTRAPVGPSPGDAMTLSLTAFEARTDMLERTRVVCDAAPKAASVAYTGGRSLASTHPWMRSAPSNTAPPSLL